MELNRSVSKEQHKTSIKVEQLLIGVKQTDRTYKKLTNNKSIYALEYLK